MTEKERIDIANLTKLRLMQTILQDMRATRLEDDSMQQDIGIPLAKWIERLEERVTS